MEPLTLFASTIGFISALHIVFSAKEFITSGRHSQRSTEGKREDWFCFFQPSDLLGTTENDNSKLPLRDENNLEQRRRQQANRPRLQA